jgi:hypothetical protein
MTRATPQVPNVPDPRWGLESLLIPPGRKRTAASFAEDHGKPVREAAMRIWGMVFAAVWLAMGANNAD